MMQSIPDLLPKHAPAPTDWFLSMRSQPVEQVGFREHGHNYEVAMGTLSFGYQLKLDDYG